MANFTRKAIIETFITLLEDRPLSDITVKDIVNTCGINRNTFYYHFQDLPDLIEVIVKEEAEGIILKYPSMNTIVECFDAVAEFASNKKMAIMHIYNSVNREMFERYLMEVCESFVKMYMRSAFEKSDFSEADRNAAKDYYKCTLFGLTIDWLNKGMAPDYIQSIRRIFLLKKDMAFEVSSTLENQI